MAVATATATVTKVVKTGRTIRCVGSIAITAGPDTYATGGLTLSLAGKVAGTNRAPLFVRIQGKAGFTYLFDYGTDITNGKVMVFCNTAGGADAALGEHSTGAVAAGVSGDTIRFEADFDSLV